MIKEIIGWIFVGIFFLVIGFLFCVAGVVLPTALQKDYEKMIDAALDIKYARLSRETKIIKLSELGLTRAEAINFLDKK